jgi:hypothetical protein
MVQVPALLGPSLTVGRSSVLRCRATFPVTLPAENHENSEPRAPCSDHCDPNGQRVPGASQDHPANVDAARKALTTARSDIEHTGGGWGGHLENAIGHIDQAMKELDAAEKYAKEHHLEK